MERRTVPARTRRRPGRQRPSGAARSASRRARDRRPRPRPWPRPPPAPSRCPPVPPLLPPTGVVQRCPGDGHARWPSPSTTAPNTEVVAAFAAVRRRHRHPADVLPERLLPRRGRTTPRRSRPLVESGQVALGNHTWSHPDLTTLGDARGGRGDRPQPGVPARRVRRPRQPVLPAAVRRPRRAHRPDRRRAGHPTIAMWNGTLEDPRVLDPGRAHGGGPGVVRRRRRSSSATPTTPTVTTVYGELLDADRRAGADDGDPRRRVGDARPALRGDASAGSAVVG